MISALRMQPRFDTDGRKGCMDDPLFKVDFKKIISDTLEVCGQT